MSKTIALVLGLSVLAKLVASDVRPTPASGLVVHEWGTFTSVANEYGAPAAWAPLSGPADLPCFVERAAAPSIKAMPGLVRMETPVLYFYPEKRMTASVHVDFPKGWITEWYPQAKSPDPRAIANGFGNGSIEWPSIELAPGENPKLPMSNGPSHYFAARETDAAPLNVGGQWEKLLFYRGIASFQVPPRPKFTSEGRLEITNRGNQPLPWLMVFENRQGRIGYRTAADVKEEVTLDSPALTSTIEQIQHELQSRLVASGLYEKEAAAMIATWKDSWFEEGTRVFYIYPSAEIDRLLPLKISPAPAKLARVFVGRAEVLAPWIDETVSSAIRQGQSAPLTRFGRFLDPFIEQMQRTQTSRLFGNPTLEAARREVARAVNYGSCVK